MALQTEDAQLPKLDFSPFLSIPGLEDFGDFFASTSAGHEVGAGVDGHLVPVPGALLLGCIGLAFANWKLQRRKEDS